MTANEREQVAKLAARIREWQDDDDAGADAADVLVCDAASLCDALLSAPTCCGPCSTCRHRAVFECARPIVYCGLLSGESAVYCDDVGGCRAWTPKEGARER